MYQNININRDQKNMATFGKDQKQTYNKMRLFSSITPIQIDEKKLSNDDLFEVCKYTQWSAISDKIAERLRNFRNKDNKTCLHIAAEYDNKNLVIGLVRNRINDPNSLSAQHENPLMLALRNNRLPKSDKIIMFLSKHTNLKEKDMDDKYAFEIQQEEINSSRAKILKYLEKKTKY